MNKRIIESVYVGQIKMDRYPLNPATLSLIRYLEANGSVPPIKIVKLKSGGYRIKNGRHRITAFKMLGRKKIKAKFSTVPEYETFRRTLK